METQATIEAPEVPEIDLLKDVTAKLTLRRKVLNKRQYEVAEEAKVSSALVNLFENGGTNISLKNLSKISRALKMKIIIDVVEEEPEDTSLEIEFPK